MDQLLGVIGDPIEHSLSPVMHHRWYVENELPHHYHAFHLKKEHLSDGINAIKTLQLRGINVTIPHKIEIIPFLDELDEEARLLGAVNTVVNEKGKLKGYNTDGRGLAAAIEERWPKKLEHASVLIIGAGGASLGVALTLSKMKAAKVDVANRTLEKAAHICNQCQAYTTSSALTLEEAEHQLKGYSIVINSTPVGMAPDWLTESPLPLTHLKQGTACIDLIYNPLKTRWLREAEEKGADIMNGLPMLIHQGALSFEHWFGIRPETESMITYLTQLLEARHVNR